MKRRKRCMIWTVCICLIMSLAGMFPLSARADGKVVRVGLYQKEGYHEIDAHGNHGGYDYEYLEEIAQYTGWTYEFVEGSWEDCVNWLRDGEIDLLGGVEKTMDRLETMHFSSTPSMYVTSCLLVLPDQEGYAYQDFNAFDGMRIGTIKGSALSDTLEDYGKKHQFSYTLRRYETEEELREAMEIREVDSAYLSSGRDLSNYKLIASFGYTQLYYAVSNRRADLHMELEKALEKIHEQDHYYESKLNSEYFSGGIQFGFTKEEEEYIQQHGTVQVALGEAFPLICQKDGNGYSGIIIDALERLSELTGLEFVYTEIPEGMQTGDYLAANKNVLVAPFFLNSLINYGSNIKILDTIVQSKMIMIGRAGETLDLDRGLVMAIPEDMVSAEAKLEELFPQVQFVTCASHWDSIGMVKKDKADFTLVNEISGAYMLQSPYFKDLKTIGNDSILEDVTMSLHADSDPLLVSILNKGISSFDERSVRQMVVDNTVSYSYRLTPQEWFYENWVVTLLVLILAASLVFILYTSSVWKRQSMEEEARLEIAEEVHKADLEYQRKMFRQANFDALTGLYNKNYFIERAGEALEAHPDRTYLFFWINLDKFKMINELYGQEKGDLVLKEVADKLRREVDPKGVYARLYSDQFIVCYPVTDREKIRECQNLLYLDCDGQEIRVQMKVGIYVNEQHSMDVNQLMDYAQIALRNGEAATGDHFYYYQDAYLEKQFKNQKITVEMEDALREGQFQVYLQPQYEIVSNKLVGAEALVRWRHPAEGLVPPNEFIPVFEENGFIYKLDSYICEQVCRLLADWKKRGKIVPVSINLSRCDLQNPGILDMLKRMADKYEIPIQYLHLEITESVYTENQGEVTRVIGALRQMGFLVEMDDFGSGYSSLNMLKDTPVDVLKLDMKFFDGETHMDRGGNIIESMVNLAHSLGILVIAEGVELEREANFLRSIRCYIAQGYRYGRPMPVPEFEALLEKSPIENKMLRLEREKSSNLENLYWTLEKYHVLLKTVDAVLMDYDPVTDRAVFTTMGEELQEQRKSHYAEIFQKGERVHPDDRERLRRALMEGGEGVEELEFRADRGGDGVYERMSGIISRYCTDGKPSRVIAAFIPKAAERGQ